MPAIPVSVIVVLQYVCT